MELRLSDSKVIQDIVRSVLGATINGDDADQIFDTMMFREEKTGNLIHAINELLIKRGYAIKAKDVLSKLMEALSDRVSVRVIPEKVELAKLATQNIIVEVMNQFDMPLVFDTMLEDRDNFAGIIYDNKQEAFFNNFAMEAVIDSGGLNRFKFKLGRGEGDTKSGTSIFVVVRSKEVGGLNWLGKLSVTFLPDSSSQSLK